MSLLLFFRPKLTAAGAAGPSDHGGYDDRKKKLIKKVRRNVNKIPNTLATRKEKQQYLKFVQNMVLEQLELVAEYEQAMLLFMILEDND